MEASQHVRRLSLYQHQGKRARNAAVMMFIHGGGNGSGSESVAFYDGTILVQDNEGIIVVTFKKVSESCLCVYMAKARELSAQRLWISQCTWSVSSEAESRINGSGMPYASKANDTTHIFSDWRSNGSIRTLPAFAVIQRGFSFSDNLLGHRRFISIHMP
jgi:hypothetical protein